MTFLTYQQKRRALIFCMAFLCVLQIATPLYQAQAAVLTIRTWQTPTDPDWIASYILKPLLRILLALVIQSIVDATVAWIRGDEGRNVGFVKNLEQELINQVDFRAGEVINRIAGINLCSVNLRNFVTLQLKFPGGDYNNLKAQLTCSLSGIVANVDNFYQNFDNGGWPAFVAITADPRNNAVGASLIALQNVSAARGTVADVLKQKINASGGFQGVQIQKQSEKCEWVNNPEGDAQIDPWEDQGGGEGGFEGGGRTGQSWKCYTLNEVTTPGKLISETLNKSLNDVGFDFMSNETANIGENIANAIMQALAERLLKEVRNNLF